MIWKTTISTSTSQKWKIHKLPRGEKTCVTSVSDLNTRKCLRLMLQVQTWLRTVGKGPYKDEVTCTCVCLTSSWVTRTSPFRERWWVDLLRLSPLQPLWFMQRLLHCFPVYLGCYYTQTLFSPVHSVICCKARCGSPSRYLRFQWAADYEGEVADRITVHGIEFDKISNTSWKN